MEEFFIKLINALPIAIVALPLGWLGGSLKSYFSEKGKNLATKEDIEIITSKVEAVKVKFEALNYKSSSLIERQIKAFDEIATELADFQIYCLRQMNEPNEHAVPYEILKNKSTFQRAVHLQEISHRQRIFISKNIFKQVNQIAQKIFVLGTQELHAEQLGNVKSQTYNEIRLEAKKVMGEIRKEIFPDEELNVVPNA